MKVKSFNARNVNTKQKLKQEVSKNTYSQYMKVKSFHIVNTMQLQKAILRDT